MRADGRAGGAQGLYLCALLTGTVTASEVIAVRTGRVAAAALGAAVLSEASLIALGRRYGSTKAERALALPGDDLVAHPSVVTDHAATIDAPPDDVWPWLVQVGW